CLSDWSSYVITSDLSSLRLSKGRTATLFSRAGADAPPGGPFVAVLDWIAWRSVVTGAERLERKKATAAITAVTRTRPTAKIHARLLCFATTGATLRS